VMQAQAGRGPDRLKWRPLAGPSACCWLAALALIGPAPPCVAQTARVQLAQGSADLLEMGKKALGLGKTTPEGSEQTGIAHGVPFLVRFRDTVGSLEPGAPVLVRGMRMGTVREVKVTFDPATTSFVIPVTIELDPAPFTAGEVTDDAATRVYRMVDAMIGHGLRARIEAANLLPGSLAVALEITPEAPPAQLGHKQAEPPEIPTVAVPFQSLNAHVEQVIDRISALPLEPIAADLQRLITAARRLAEDPALPQILTNLATASDALVPAARQLEPTLRAAAAMAAQARAGVADVQGLLDQSGTLPDQLAHSLEEFQDAARSMRVLAEMLERQPEALLRGRGR
jgi:paraquat-inducible protein B